MARKDLFALLAITFLYMLGRGMVSPLSPAYFEVAHVSILGIGFLLGSFGLAFLVSEAAWGFVSARVWSRWTLLGLILVSSLLPIPMSQPQPFAVLLAIQVAYGLCLGGMGVLPRLLVPRLVESRDEAKSFGYLGLVFALGAMAGSLLGGAVYGTVGLSSSFLVSALVSISPVLPLCFLNFRGTAASATSPAFQTGAEPKRPRALLRQSQLLVLGFVGLTTAAASIFYNLLLPNILARGVSYSATVSDISLVIALFSFSSGAFQPVMGLGGSRNPRGWITVAMVGCALTFVLLIYSSSMTAIYLASFLSGVASSVVTPLALSELSGGVLPSKLGKVFGLYGAAEDSGIILGALAGSFLWAGFGATSTFVAMAVLFFTTGLIYGLVSARSRQTRDTRFVRES